MDPTKILHPRKLSPEGGRRFGSERHNGRCKRLSKPLPVTFQVATPESEIKRSFSSPKRRLSRTNPPAAPSKRWSFHGQPTDFTPYNNIVAERGPHFLTSRHSCHDIFSQPPRLDTPFPRSPTPFSPVATLPNQTFLQAPDDDISEEDSSLNDMHFPPLSLHPYRHSYNGSYTSMICPPRSMTPSTPRSVSLSTVGPTPSSSRTDTPSKPDPPPDPKTHCKKRHSLSFRRRSASNPQRTSSAPATPSSLRQRASHATSTVAVQARELSRSVYMGLLGMIAPSDERVFVPRAVVRKPARRWTEIESAGASREMLRMVGDVGELRVVNGKAEDDDDDDKNN